MLIEVIILTGQGSISSAADCCSHGAFEYLLKPCRLDQIVSSISNAYSKRIKAKNEEKTACVQEIMDRAIGLSPLEMIEELRKLDSEDC